MQRYAQSRNNIRGILVYTFNYLSYPDHRNRCVAFVQRSMNSQHSCVRASMRISKFIEMYIDFFFISFIETERILFWVKILEKFFDELVFLAIFNKNTSMNVHCENFSFGAFFSFVLWAYCMWNGEKETWSARHQQHICLKAV